MGSHVNWGACQTLAADVALAFSESDVVTLDLKQAGADIVLVQLEVVFPAATDGDMVATFCADIDDGDHPDVGTSVTTLTITDEASTTQRGTVLLANPYPYYQITIQNDDGSEEFVYTVRYRFGTYA